MKNNKLSKFSGTFKYYTTLGLSMAIILGSSLSALALPKTTNSKLANSIRITRLKAEINGEAFMPTVEMIKNAPDIVKAEMEAHKAFMQKMEQLQSQVNSTESKLGKYQSAYKKGIASKAEVRIKTHQLNALKAQVYSIITDLLGQLENQIILDSDSSAAKDLALEIKDARLDAELNHISFKPTDEMQQQAPDMVATQMKIYETHLKHMKVVSERISLAKEEMQIADEAYSKGAISKAEHFKIKQNLNTLDNLGLILHTKILQDHEQLELLRTQQDKLSMAKEVKQLRLEAEINNTEFNPTAKMKQNVPEMVALEKELHEYHTKIRKLLNNRTKMLQDKYNVAKGAYQAGVMSQADLAQIKTQLDSAKAHIKKVEQHALNELKRIRA